VKLTLESIGEALRSYYDRLIALLAVLALLASLVLLMMRLGAIKADEQRFQDWQKGLVPEFADATNVTLDVFTHGHNSLTNPFQISVWSNALSTPELRVSCIDCARPIPDKASECPWCKAKQEEIVVSKDKDEDGMDDVWEVANGLNPLDPDDAKADPDKDGFSNLEEFRFGTDPRDPAGHPPMIAKLRLVEIKATPFHLKFMAVTKMTAGEIHQINSTKSGKTSWYKMGDDVEGYALTAYKPVFVQESSGAGNMKVEKDRSTLSLKSKTSDRLISLQKGEATPISEYEARFLFEIDGSEFTVKHGADFDLRGVKFAVKEIDNKDYRVLIVDKDSGKETSIGRQAETGASSHKSGAGN
jgi:hypothetical protein